jgi:hypothetical protein
VAPTATTYAAIFSSDIADEDVLAEVAGSKQVLRRLLAPISAAGALTALVYVSSGEWVSIHGFDKCEKCFGEARAPAWALSACNGNRGDDDSSSSDYLTFEFAIDSETACDDKRLEDRKLTHFRMLASRIKYSIAIPTRPFVLSHDSKMAEGIPEALPVAVPCTATARASASSLVKALAKIKKNAPQFVWICVDPNVGICVACPTKDGKKALSRMSRGDEAALCPDPVHFSRARVRTLETTGVLDMSVVFPAFLATTTMTTQQQQQQKQPPSFAAEAVNFNHLYRAAVEVHKVWDEVTLCLGGNRGSAAAVAGQGDPHLVVLVAERSPQFFARVALSPATDAELASEGYGFAFPRMAKNRRESGCSGRTYFKEDFRTDV